MKPDRITIRTYQVGFGDCFLVSFRYSPLDERHVLIDFGSTSLPEGAPKTLLVDVAEDIRKRTDGKLTGVVATHRHKDHVFGFATGPKDPGKTIAAMEPDLVVQPWTEDPKLAVDATGPAPPDAPHAAVRISSLAAMQRASAQVLREATRSRYLPSGLKAQIAFLGEDNIGNASAVKNLMTMAPNEYAHAGQRSGLEGLLPGVEVHVLGPPTVEQTPTIKKQRSKDEDEFWHLRAGAAGRVEPRGAGGTTPLFPGFVAAKGSRLPVEARWLAHHLKRLRGEQMLSIVRMLDKAMNNTSLILLFKVGGKSLLFPGDAQIENWRYALNQPSIRKMLADVDVYKVGHHGSLNATPKTLWEGFKRRSTNAAAPGRMTSLMSTMPGKHGSVDRKTEVPRQTLADALALETHHHSTESLPAGELFHELVIDLP